jgi:hypothetical protein
MQSEDPNAAKSAVPAIPAKKRKARSPSYPFLNLKDAIDCAGTLWTHERHNWVRSPIAAAHWNFSSKSSGALLTVTALKRYGLIEEEGSGDQRQIRLSDFALKILREEEGSDLRLELLKTAALRPDIYRDLWNRYKDQLPSPKNLENYLEFDLKFTLPAARSVIKNYTETVKFAKLSGSDSISEMPNESLTDPPSVVAGQSPGSVLEPVIGGHKSPASSISIREFPVPLPSGAVAAFKVPFPMSEQDYQLYERLLKAFKAALVPGGKDVSPE